MRDRRAPLAVLVLAAAYVAILAWGARLAIHALAGSAPPTDPLAHGLLVANTALLGWRLTMRMGCTRHSYGWREALWSVPRLFVGNVIALVAAPRALARYLAMLRGGAPVWDKTAHRFPDLAGAG